MLCRRVMRCGVLMWLCTLTLLDDLELVGRVVERHELRVQLLVVGRERVLRCVQTKEAKNQPKNVWHRSRSLVSPPALG